MIEKIDIPPYAINKKILKRFNQRQTVFGRKIYDKKSDFYKKGMYNNSAKIISKNTEGYSRIDFAKMIGSWTAYDYFHNAFSWERLVDANSVMEKPELEKFPVKDALDMSREIKKAAIQYGASQVGITCVNNLWLYSKDMDDNPIKVPEEYKFAIVMTIKMYGFAIKTSPSLQACTATGIAYSQMAFLIGCVLDQGMHLLEVQQKLQRVIQ